MCVCVGGGGEMETETEQWRRKLFWFGRGGGADFQALVYACFTCTGIPVILLQRVVFVQVFHSTS